MATANTQMIHFNLKDSIENNWNLYQEALEKTPELFKQLKWRYDQYLKTLPHYTKEQSEEQPIIEFDIAE